MNSRQCFLLLKGAAVEPLDLANIIPRSRRQANLKAEQGFDIPGDELVSDDESDDYDETSS